mgnify:CR=1 FL=1
MNPGWNLVLPIFQSFKKVDIRTKAVDVPEQDAITKDNVSVRINAVIYYKVFDASKAASIQNFDEALKLELQEISKHILNKKIDCNQPQKIARIFRDL